MSDHYCQACASKVGWLGNLPTTNITGSVYQADKFVKHTAPARVYQVNSIFDDPAAVEGCMINAAASGSVEVDSNGRHNVVWIADTNVGILQVNGQPTVTNDAVKLVLPYDALKVHSFPTSSANLQTETCKECGGQAFR